MVAIAGATPAEQRVWQCLEAVCDPEIPVVSLRELGILRAVHEDAAGIEVVITPTYSGCPAMGQIEDDVRSALAAAEPGKPMPTVRVTTQLAPAWTTDWITPEAREKLRAWGIAPPQHTIEGGTQAAARGDSVLRFAPRRATPPTVPCPRCGSGDTTETSHFGSTSCKALYRCLSCSEPFDYMKPY